MQKIDSAVLIFQDQVLERLFTDLMMMGCRNNEVWNNLVLDKNKPVSSIVVYFYMENLIEVYTHIAAADAKVDFQIENYETAIEKVFNIIHS